MLIVHSVSELRRQIAHWRGSGDRIVLVPTMGNLHPGHFSLIQRARELGERVVATIFVNPTQFSPGEDFAAYPRTLERDAEALQAQGCDLLFHPGMDDMYPLGIEAAVSMHVPGIADILCGAFRPGHFDGVATVVTRLLNVAQPDTAVFGSKDYQQLMVIRHVVADLQMPIAIEAADTVRDPSGLAMSSRNQYLSDVERVQASALHATLVWMRGALLEGIDWRRVESLAIQRLSDAGFRPDYASVRRAADLMEPLPGQTMGLVVLIAARLGKARLIDNLLI